MTNYEIELFKQVFEAIPSDELVETFTGRIPNIVYSPDPRCKAFEFPITKEKVPLLNNNLLITKNFYDVEPYIDKFKVFGYPCLNQPNVRISLGVCNNVFIIIVSKEMYSKSEVINFIEKIWKNNSESIYDWRPAITDYINKLMLDVKAGFESKRISIPMALPLSDFLVGCEMTVQDLFEYSFEHDCKWIKTTIKIEKSMLTLSCEHLFYEYINNLVLGNFDASKDVVYKLTSPDRKFIMSYLQYGFNIPQLMESVLRIINFHHEFLVGHHFEFDRLKMEIRINAPKQNNEVHHEDN